MSTAYSTLLGLALPVQGELQGVWGDTVNNYITNYLDASVAGTQTLSTDADVTLTKTTGTSLGSTSSQYAIINCTGARTALRTITAPAASKIYIVINATTGGYSVKLVGAGPTTGLTIPNGASATVAWNGSDFVEIGGGTIGNLTVNGNLTVTGTSTLTGNVTYSAGTANQVQFLNASKVLSGSSSLTWDGTYLTAGSIKDSALTSGRVTYAGASGLLQDSSSLTFDGTTLTAGGLATGGSVTLSGGTANGVLYLNGSKVATSGSALTFDGTNLGLQVTPNAWSTTTSVFENPSGSIYTFSGTNQIGLNSNAYYNGTNWIYRNASSVGASDFFQQNGFFVWRNAAAGTSGNTISFSELMRLTSTGLGIGTSSPGVKLDVRGATGVGIRWLETSSGNSTRVQLGTASGLGYIDADAGTGSIALGFRVGGADLMRLDTSGNLGLGVTPSGWGSDYKALQIGGSATASLSYKNFVTSLSQNVYSTNTQDIALVTGNAAKYEINGSGQHIWKTASATAGNAITFTQAMTLTAGGILLLGTANSPAASGAKISAYDTGDTSIQITKGGVVAARLKAVSTALAFGVDTSDGDTERARIDSSGNLLRGQTTSGNDNSRGFYSDTAGYFGQNHLSGDASGSVYAYFGYNGASIGTITQNGTTGVLFNTSSDRRLKDNIVPAPSASAVIDAIQIVSHDWKAAPDEHVTYGVIAQDLHAVAPQAVTVGDDGDEIEKPWGVDYSKLVPLLIKEVQSLRARVAQLESK